MDSGPAPWGPSKGSTGFAISLESVPAAGADARRQLAGLADRLPAAALGDLRTVVSELVNNCVVHGSGGPIELSIEQTLSGFIRGTVSDGGMGPVKISSPPVGEGGWGLRLVDLLASRWGVNVPSSDVWFEMPLTARRLKAERSEPQAYRSVSTAGDRSAALREGVDSPEQT